MLLQFLVSNYASIKNEVMFSLIPSSDKEHPENIITIGKYRAHNLAAIYGANASGKSNLFKAMTNAIVFIRLSHQYQVGQKIPVAPFGFRDNHSSYPSKFEFTFIADDNQKYIYGFSATIDRVCEEYLYVFHTAKPSMIFERTEDRYRFSRNTKTDLLPLIKWNTPNKLFLSTATSWNVECTKTPFRWFSEKIETQTGTDTLQGPALADYDEHKEENIQFVKNLMRLADINIIDVDVETHDLPDDQPPFPGFGGIVINNQIIKPQNHTTEIRTIHSITDESGNEKHYSLNLQEESLGTIQLFFFAPQLRKTLENGKVLFIDEIDRSLHPLIVRFLIGLFRSEKTNPHGAQLLFTTHDTTLLSLETFRRDQVYFTEKDPVTSVTDLYSLDDFSVRKDENIEKGYLLGRYGAVPYLQTEEIV